MLVFSFSVLGHAPLHKQRRDGNQSVQSARTAAPAGHDRESSVLLLIRMVPAEEPSADVQQSAVLAERGGILTLRVSASPPAAAYCSGRSGES